MNALLEKIAGAIATFTVALILNKFFSTFRVRQLYLAYENALEYTTQSKSGHTVMLTISNKGKEKEKNVNVIIPRSKKISILSSSCPDIDCDNNQFKIERILSGESITLVLLIKDGEKISKSNLPIIKSDDVNGKCYSSVKNMPPSLGPAIFSLSLFFAVIALLGVSAYKGYDPFEVAYSQYYKLRFSTFYSRGFDNNTFDENSLIKQYDTSKNEFPIDLKSIEIISNNIEYTFLVNNSTSQNISVGLSFTVKNSRAYYDELGESLNIREDKVRRAKLTELRKKYNILENEYGYTYSVDQWVDKGQAKEIKIIRPIVKGLDYQSLGVNIRMRNDSNNKDFYGDYTFKPELSALAKNKLDPILRFNQYPLK